ncbi:MAG: hypothetical protein ACRD07_00460 [Acidimicrobiales bacterium]
MGITIEYSGGTTAESTVLDTAVSGRAGALRQAGTRLAPHGVTIAFGLVVVASAGYFVRITRASWFYADEWAMAVQVARVQDIVDPYNGHLSITILGLYRVLLEVFGFTTHLPYRIAGIVSLVAVPVAMFLVARRRVGAPAAAIMGLLLLWFRGISLEPGALNHSLSLLGAVVCGYALVGRGRRDDALVAASLAFALASSGGGVAVVVAAVVHSLCARATLTRWLAVLLPTGAWLVWWLVFVPPDSEAVQALRPGVLDLAEDAVRHAAASFKYLALGNRVAGGVLLVMFIAHAGWRVRRGLAAAANVLAWSAALLFWWFGLVWSRWLLIEATPGFRYQWVSAGYVLLAVLPAGHGTLPRWASASTRRGALLGSAGVLLVAAALTHSVRPDVRDFARTHAAYGRINRGQAAVAAEPNAGLSDDVTFGFNLGRLTAGQLRQLLDNYGGVGDPGETDELLVDIGAVRLVNGRPDPPPPGCEALRQPIPAPPDSRVELHAPTGTAEVSVRRFGSDWVSVGRLQEGRRATLELPGLTSGQQWELNGSTDVCVSVVPG